MASGPHLPAPDFSRPLLEVPSDARGRILAALGALYGAERAKAAYPEIERLMRVHYAHKTPEGIAQDRAFDAAQRLTERDVILTTYGDLLASPSRPPLQALSSFLDRFMRGAVNTVHILPFYPYSSDRGFAVMDYLEVDPRLGTWADIEDLGGRYRLMFDGVFNHVSSKSRWFQRFLNGRPGYDDYFVAFSTREAVDRDHRRLILRPRTSDLLTPFQTLRGPRHVWTTFGPDQIDLNYRNEQVLFRILETLLLYVRRGADIIRLDAVAYVWRELGTRCALLRQTHTLVQLFRAVLDAVAPRVALITETNVPHVDNVSYFGDGTNEAQMVYNFALPPLILDAFHTADARCLAEWAAGLAPGSPTTTFLNILDSHDGIGLLGARGILTEERIAALVDRVTRHGGLVSYRSDGDGNEAAYELNCTWYSALNPDDASEPQALQVARYIASRSIALCLRGVPGIYLPGVFGARNDTEAVLAGREKRSINRKTLDEPLLVQLLSDRRSSVHQVATRLRRLVRRRVSEPAFHPNAPQAVLDAGPGVFALRRGEGDRAIVCLTNVTPRPQHVRLPEVELTLEPYGVRWIAPLRRRARITE